ncbi:hypothetical protein VP1G_02300 [Cytospora mali]|uniref:UBL3-like ubiquitin domain-containing protein n=1 Tax=Cytospora mali TaxID=578113 RepID=A0A194USY2_CYTMA|nr:hypothetical protein VP1G_02300 [Valsa mali var. pyri (nom. inval.)]
MAESEPTMSGGQGGQGGATEPKESLQQPDGAVEMDKIDPATPAVPAKDDAPAAAGPTAAEEAASSTSIKGKEKEVAPSQTRQDRTDSLSIGAADAPPASSPANAADGPVCNITLLLPTGARHPYKIDDKYLTKRNVDVPDISENGKKDPFSISVYKLKELILREWRDEWEGKPASPSSIRLIHFGKLLDDKEQLNKYQFSAEAPNVVHMSVKPAEMLEEDEAGKGKSGSSSGRNTEGGSGCCVIL